MADNAELAAVLRLTDAFSTQFDKFRAEAKAAASKSEQNFEELNQSIHRVGDNLEKAGSAGKGFGASMLDTLSKVGNIVTGISTAVMAIGKAFATVFRAITRAVSNAIRIVTNLTRTVIRFGERAVAEFRSVALGLDKIAKAAAKFGVAAEFMSGMRLAVELTGTSIQALGVGLRTGARNLSDYRDGVGEAVDAFEKLGITQDEARDKIKSSSDLLLVMAERWGNLRGPIEEVAVAQEILGRSGTELVPILKAGPEAIREWITEMEALGGVFDKFELGRVEEMNDAITRAGFAVNSLKERFVVELAPAVTKVFTEAKNAIIAFAKENGDRIKAFVTTAAAYIEAWGVAGVKIFKDVFSFAVQESGLAWDAIKRALGATLIGIGLSIVDGFTAAFKIVGRVISNIWERLFVDRFGDIAAKGVNVVIDLFGWFTRQISKAIQTIQACHEFVWTNIGAAFVTYVVNPVIDGLNFIVKSSKIAWATIKAAFDFVAENIKAGFNRVVSFVAGAVEKLIGVLRSVESVVGDLGLGKISDSIAKFRRELDTTGMTAGELVDNLSKGIATLDFTPAIGKMTASGMTFDQMIANIGRRIAETDPVIKKFFDSLKLDVADVPLGKIFQTSIAQGLKDSQGDIDKFLAGLTGNFIKAFDDAFKDADPKLKALLEKIAAHAAEATAKGAKAVTDGIKKAGETTNKIKDETDKVDGKTWSEGWIKGIEDLKKSFSSFQSGVAAITDTVNSVADALESRLFETMEKGFKNAGEAAWNFAQDVIRAFQRILIHQAVQSLFNKLLSSFGGALGSLGGGTGEGARTGPDTWIESSYLKDTAKGAEFQGGVKRWAEGGLPDLMREPTFFKTRDGQWNVAGEAGDEFVMPAARTSSGEMGVKAQLPPDAGKKVITYQDNRTISIDFNPKVQAQDARGVGQTLRQAEDRLVARVMEALAETTTGHNIVRSIIRRTI